MPHDQLVLDVVADLLDLEPDELAADTPLAAVAGWDSVNALRVLVYLERRLGTSVDYQDFEAAVTVADLVALADRAADRITAGPRRESS
jgi:acyl carrier protein